MTFLTQWRSAILLVAAATGTAWAQEATPSKPPSAHAPASGSVGRQLMQGCCGRHDTSGWSMMSRQERRDHHDKMMAMTDHGACTTHMQDHHAKMVERAKARGVTMPAQPRRDACAALKR